MSSSSTNMDRINSLLAKFPRVELANIPTPLEKMQRLSQHIVGPMYFSKRDDLTGFAGGGNKARQLEYSFGDAIRCGADMILITGAVQSNYVRSAAAAAAKLGLSCHVQLENRVGDMPPSYHRSGNVLLNKLFGASSSTFHIGEDEAAADASIADMAKNHRKKGKKPKGGSAAKRRADEDWRKEHADSILSAQQNLVAASYTGLHGGGSDLPRLFRALDRNNSGKLEFEEFAKAIREKAQIDTHTWSQADVGRLYDSLIGVPGQKGIDQNAFEMFCRLGSEDCREAAFFHGRVE